MTWKEERSGLGSSEWTPLHASPMACRCGEKLASLSTSAWRGIFCSLRADTMVSRSCVCGAAGDCKEVGACLAAGTHQTTGKCQCLPGHLSPSAWLPSAFCLPQKGPQ